VPRLIVLLAGLGVLVAPGPAQAYKLMDVTPQPRVLYFVQLKDWRPAVARAAKALNREHVGVKLVRSKIAQNAQIQFGRLDKRCGLAGVDATTQNLEGGYSVIYLPRGCHRVQASIIAAHELGHALGLAHEDRRCALMNSSGTGPQSIPTNCLGERHNWLRHPFRSDDLKGLRKLYRNRKPRARLTVAGVEGPTVRFKVRATDRDDNLSTVTVDYGDGSRVEYIAGEALPTSYTYEAPGTYTLRVIARDFYGKRGRDSASVTV
jgi:hypothetical protein